MRKWRNGKWRNDEIAVILVLVMLELQPVMDFDH